MTAVLQAHDIHCFYGKSHILHGVTIDVREGEIVTMLGRNGAGKTTTVRSLVGLTPPRFGTIEIFGHNTTHWPAHRITGLGVGYVPEERKIFGSLSVLENLKVPQAVRDHGRLIGCSSCFRAWSNENSSRDVSYPAANRRCWRLRGRSCSIRA